LGNLCLLEKPLNLEAKNKDFDEKKLIYKKSKFISDVKSCKAWDEQEITIRGRKIIDFIWNRWKLEINDLEEYSEDEFLAISMKGVRRRRKTK
jgi:hypothetical protein